MRKLYNKYDLFWSIFIAMILLVTFVFLIIFKAENKTISNVYFGFTIFGLLCIIFVWLSRKKDNITYVRGKKTIGEADKKMIDYYVSDKKYDVDTYKKAKFFQLVRFLSIVIIFTMISCLLAIIYSYI